MTEINRHANMLVKIKLAEFRKDRYFSEIADEIEQLYALNDQSDMRKFISKMNELAEKEKNESKKRKIIIAATLIAAVAAAGAAAYYFGPEVIASFTPVQASDVKSAKTIIEILSSVDAAKQVSGKISNADFNTFFADAYGKPRIYNTAKTVLQSMKNKGSYTAAKALKEILALTDDSVGVEAKDVEKILRKYNLYDKIK